MIRRAPDSKNDPTGNHPESSPFRFLQAVVDPVLILDQNAQIVWLNNGCERLLGYTLSELEGVTLWERLVVSECIDRAQRSYSSMPARRCTLDMLNKFGKRQLVEWHNCWIPGENGYVVMTARGYEAAESAEPECTMPTVIGRRQVESALQESERRFKTLFDSAAEFIFVIDPDGIIMLTNPYVSAQSGYAEEEIIGRNIKDFFTDQSRSICDCNFPGLKERGYNRAEVEFVCKDGRVLQMECSATAIPDKNDKFTSFLIIQRDVTEQKKAAEAVLDAERRFRAIFNSTFQFIGLLSPEGVLLEANRTALDFAGVPETDVVGKPFWDTIWWSASELERQRLKEAVRQAADGKLVRYETRNFGADGKYVAVDFSLKPVKNEQGETVLIVPEGRDITERKQAEEASRAHQLEAAHFMRLSIMGEMAASMAHELNQPLAALISYCGTAQSLIKRDGAPGELADILDRANHQAHRASEIIKHISNFVSKGSSKKRLVDINELILEMSNIVELEINSRDIKIEHDLDSREHKVCANPVQIEQVLLNLVRNSLEAFENSGSSGGKVSLKTRLSPGNTIRIAVTDNGPGIDETMRDSLFRPFHTSKENGMGMGLSVSRTILRSHDGKIWLEEYTDQGTSFCIELPLAETIHDNT